MSDETLQDLWARLLAGELESPGSVSNDTMSIARDLNKERAGEFQTLCSAALCYPDGTPVIVVGCGNPGANSLQPYGLSYDVLMRLAHHRLIVNDMTSYTSFAEIASQPGVEVRQQESAWLLLWPGDTRRTDANHQIKGILFTLAGKELFPVVQKIPNPVYTEAMLKALRQEGGQRFRSPTSPKCQLVENAFLNPKQRRGSGNSVCQKRRSWQFAKSEHESFGPSCFDDTT